MAYSAKQYKRSHKDTTPLTLEYNLFVMNNEKQNKVNLLIERKENVGTVTYYEAREKTATEVDTIWSNRATHTYTKKYIFDGNFFD